MSLMWRRLDIPLHARFALTRTFALTSSAFAVLIASSCGGDLGRPITTIKIVSIVIDGGPKTLERGTTITMTATARDSAGAVVSVPFAWHSSVDSIATFGLGGKLTALDTGFTIVTASALGVTSAGVQILVVFNGPAKVAAFQFNPPNAITPGADLGDSIRVVVTNKAVSPSAGAIVAFAVTAGGGTVSPAFATTTTNGVASAKWVVGPTAGLNSVTATVLRADSTVDTLVQSNPVTFTIKTYAALAIVQGDGQTGTVLSPLPVAPSVRLVDTAGKPRPGIPVTFSPTGNGRVSNAVVPTSVDGVANPGVWTLGDAQGDEQLIATVERATITLHATATGTTVRFVAQQVVTAQAATCALTSDQFVSCLGQAPQIGGGGVGDTASRSSPTVTKGGVHFTSIAGGGGAAHFCGTAPDLSIYCWGINALVDTAGVVTTTTSPTRLQSNIAWLQVSPGGQHNCALASDRSAYCWGTDVSGQLGDNANTVRFVPKPVAGGFKFANVSAGASHSCGITTDAAAFCWGLNANGQIGDGTVISRSAPTAVSGGFKFKSIGAGAAWTCGLSDANAALCWGANTNRLLPAPYVGAPSFTLLSVGAAHACALTSDGTAYCWGDNSSGQLGDNTTTFRDAPTAVATTIRFTSVSAGFQHSCGVTTDGFVACWGRNVAGELGVPVPLVQLTPRYLVLGVKP